MKNVLWKIVTLPISLLYVAVVVLSRME